VTDCGCVACAQVAAYLECARLVREAVAWQRGTIAALTDGKQMPPEVRWRDWYRAAGAAIDVLDGDGPVVVE